MQARSWLTLTLFLASCASGEGMKEAKSSLDPPKPLDPPEREAPAEPGGPAVPATPAVSAAEEREDAERRYQVALGEWLDQSRRDCGRTRDPEAYLPQREGVSAVDVELVKTRCTDAVEVALRGEPWRAALSACFDRFVKANGAGKVACRIARAAVPEVPPALFEKHVAECSLACAAGGPEVLELKRERMKPAICCDGTRSPTCTYGTLAPGCCAGHQGVCIE